MNRLSVPASRAWSHTLLRAGALLVPVPIPQPALALIAPPSTMPSASVPHAPELTPPIATVSYAVVYKYRK